MRDTALGLLARREHSARQLRDKLLARGYARAGIEGLLAELAAENLLSDARFAEAFVRAGVGKGQGPLRIRQGLRENGIDDELIDRCLDMHDGEWRERADRARRKRFGAALPGDARERARQMRFLQYRGFTPGQVRAVLREPEDV